LKHRNDIIPVYEPWLGANERKFVLNALERKEISGSAGEYIERFERGFAQYSDCRYGIAVANGTSALHLAMATLGIGQGDEVIVPTFTNMATFFAVLYQGATPVPVDIEPDTWNINPSLIEERITARTKAILPVHVFGHPADMNQIRKTASVHSLAIVEDGAEAHGATYNDKKVGSLGDVGCFSFYGNKIITTGEGGMLTTNSKAIADRARSLRSLAYGKRVKFMHQAVGYNYRMTNLQAALGCAQLEKIEIIIQKKRKVAEFYNKNLRDVPGLQLPVEKSYARNVYWMYHFLVDDELFGCSRDRLIQQLAHAGIESREAFVPFNMQEIFLSKGITKKEDCPVANRVGECGLYIPSGPQLARRQMERVAGCIRSVNRPSR
jgi:perosamine synthetase